MSELCKSVPCRCEEIRALETAIAEMRALQIECGATLARGRVLLAEMAAEQDEALLETRRAEFERHAYTPNILTRIQAAFERRSQ